MKIQMIMGLAVTLIASSAAAAIVTPGGDFEAADGAVSSLVHTVFGVQNSHATDQVTAIGGLKRHPATSADGSQSVTLQFARPAGTFINGVVWSYDLEFMFTKSFMTNSGDTGSGVTKTVTFPSTQLTNTSYLTAVAYLKPNVSVFGATVN